MRITTLTLIMSVCCLTASIVYAQPSNQKIVYRRSSLHMVLIESDKFPMKDTVIGAYNNMPFPDKYNDHTIMDKSFNPKNYILTDAERKALGQKDSKDTSSNSKDITLQIEKFIIDKKIAKQLVAKWYNRTPDGKFDCNLLAERGFYNANEMDAAVASGQARGNATLADAGEELIKNTFVVFTKLNFVKNEPIARATKEVAIMAANRISNSLLQQAAIKAAEMTYESTKEGYSVWATSWLYQLEWNDSVTAIFYNDLYNNPEAFEKSDLFKLKLVGSTKAQSLVLFSVGKSPEQIVKLATVRNIDNVFAKLQKEYEVFKVKVPVLTNDPITAQIGMKEGLEGGEKFEALEMSINPKTGRTEYVSVGKVTVDKKLIWDNRYNAGEEVVPQKDKDGNDIPLLTATTFKGSKKIQPGMLLRQLK